MIHAIVCQNDLSSFCSCVQDYFEKGGIIKDLKILETTEDQVVLIVSDKTMTQECAEAFWCGYQEGVRG